jgi:hypothetical protein
LGGDEIFQGKNKRNKTHPLKIYSSCGRLFTQ